MNNVIEISTYKTHLQVDIYIFKFYSSLLNLRRGVLNINIERGRFDNTPRGHIICPVYNMNAIENEYHFILVCPCYRNLRTK